MTGSATCLLIKLPLKLVEMPVPELQTGQVLLKVRACGICHTEIDEIEGRTPPPSYPVIPGHQVIGTIVNHQGSRQDIYAGDRVGVAWIYSACGECEFCLKGQENLCPQFAATGRDVHGGYAEYMVAHEDYVYKIPELFSDAEAAPLLCAGAIGYRSLSLCNMKNGNNLGLTGFGASAHLVLKLAQYLYPLARVYVFVATGKKGNSQFIWDAIGRAIRLKNPPLNWIVLLIQLLSGQPWLKPWLT